jgi:hypothetical protein
MGKLNKPQYDKKLTLISKQGTKPSAERPPTMGEPCATTNWDKHIQAEHNLKSFVQIVDHPQKRGEKMAQFTFPQPGEIFVAVRQDEFEFFWIWILIIEQSTGRIIQKFSSSAIQFVTWDEEEAEPEPEVKAVE